ncbi:MAG: hypothetical protein H0W72_12975 [Planctomycetes bacterium]|nr:hypothetical protein [Planctomycetota bacterium]
MRALPPAGSDQPATGSEQPTGSPLAATEPPALSTRPDIVAPNALSEQPRPATTAAPADEEILTSGGTDREVAARKAREPSTSPSWSKDRARSRLDDTSTAPAQKSGTQAPTTAPLEPATAAPERVAGQPPAQPHLGPIAPHQAPKVLEQARTAVRAGELMTARELYLRLRGTPVAAQALPEELRLMRAQGQVRTALGVIAGLEPELVSDEINIEYGRLLLAAGRAREAIAPLSKVHSSSPQASEALFLVAASLAADGRAEQARKVYGAVAAGGGAFAGQARDALARLPASPQR